jgi:hypothetical protein
MPRKQPGETSHAKRLAKSVSKNPARAWLQRARKNPARKMSGGDPGRALANERELSPLARFMGAIQAEGIRFQVIGMSAALLQGVPGSTTDVDIWIDLPARRYMRVLNIAREQGAEIVRNTVVALSDQTLLNFVYEVTGLGSFASEFRKAKTLIVDGLKVRVLSLESIRKSKLAIGRPKDVVQVQQIEAALTMDKASREKRK